MSRQVRPALVLLAGFTLITGVAYPLGVSALAGLLFPEQAGGSLVRRGDVAIGSMLIGQPWDDPACFWGRPSPISPTPYEACSSSGSNLGPTNPALVEAVKARVAALRAADPTPRVIPIPVDLVTASGSGLDPHVSPAAALYQVPRVAAHRGKATEADLTTLVESCIEGRTLGFLGEPRVNVLRLNLALDERWPRPSAGSGS